jgi:pSer/pThr/pTyr-binding forkhead associated (FHA) protein
MEPQKGTKDSIKLCFLAFCAFSWPCRCVLSSGLTSKPELCWVKSGHNHEQEDETAVTLEPNFFIYECMRQQTQFTARLIFTDELFSGQVYSLVRATTTVGRGDQNILVIKHNSISATHCEILFNGPEVIVRDLGSRNGTMVRGVKKLQNQQTQLKNGDTVCFGSVEARLELVSIYDDEPSSEISTLYDRDRCLHALGRACVEPRPVNATQHLESPTPPIVQDPTVLLPAEVLTGLDPPQNGNPNLTVSYRVAFCDRLAYLVYHLTHHPIILLPVGAFLGITFYLILPGVVGLPGSPSLPVKVMNFLFNELLLALVLVAACVIPLLLLMISPGSKPRYYDEKLTLGEQELIDECPYGKSEIHWTMMQKLVRTGHHIFMYLNRDNALIIPRRAFETDAKWDLFYDFCRQQTDRANEA